MDDLKNKVENNFKSKEPYDLKINLDTTDNINQESNTTITPTDSDQLSVNSSEENIEETNSSD